MPERTRQEVTLKKKQSVKRAPTETQGLDTTTFANGPKLAPVHGKVNRKIIPSASNTPVLRVQETSHVKSAPVTPLARSKTSGQECRSKSVKNLSDLKTKPTPPIRRGKGVKEGDPPVKGSPVPSLKQMSSPGTPIAKVKSEFPPAYGTLTKKPSIEAISKEPIEILDAPLTTVVISTPNGVHVQPPIPKTHAVDKRTGRYLALGVTITMIFITLYHTFLRQVPLLAGLVPPAIIMVLYLLYVIYFAKERKRQVQIVMN